MTVTVTNPRAVPGRSADRPYADGARFVPRDELPGTPEREARVSALIASYAPFSVRQPQRRAGPKAEGQPPRPGDRDGQRFCRHCVAWVDLALFWRSARRADGIATVCVACKQGIRRKCKAKQRAGRKATA